MSGERKQVIADLKEHIHLAEWVDDPYAENVKVSLLKDAVAQIENEQKPRWIPVTERLPDAGKEVLVTYDIKGYRSVYIGEYCGGKFIGYDDEFLTSEGRKYRKAVAWMPLPEPPKEEDDDA